MTFSAFLCYEVLLQHGAFQYCEGNRLQVQVVGYIHSIYGQVRLEP